jgi:hypothetical protein
MRIRNWEPDTDYPLFLNWWAGHKTAPCSRALLPAVGLVACRDVPACDIAVAWLYQDNSCGWAALGRILSNPQSPARQVAAAIPAIVSAAEEVAATHGRLAIFCPASVRGVERVLSRARWAKAHSAVEYWKLTKNAKNEESK